MSLHFVYIVHHHFIMFIHFQLMLFHFTSVSTLIYPGLYQASHSAKCGVYHLNVNPIGVPVRLVELTSPQGGIELMAHSVNVC